MIEKGQYVFFYHYPNMEGTIRKFPLFTRRSAPFRKGTVLMNGVDPEGTIRQVVLSRTAPS